jgi:hypothetical protein
MDPLHFGNLDPGPASASNKNPDADPHQIKIGNRIRIRVMRIHNTLKL